MEGLSLVMAQVCWLGLGEQRAYALGKLAHLHILHQQHNRWGQLYKKQFELVHLED